VFLYLTKTLGRDRLVVPLLRLCARSIEQQGLPASFEGGLGVLVLRVLMTPLMGWFNLAGITGTLL
jgi:hypothetical protein